MCSSVTSNTPDRHFSYLLHDTILFTLQYALKQHYPKCSLQFLILDVSSTSLQQVLCGQGERKIISRMEGTRRTIFLVSSFTSASKSCLNIGRRHFEEKLQTSAIV